MVVAIMGIVVMAIYSLYQGNQQSSMKQDDVVELQQNLRIAMEQMRRDILLAGFMCSSGSAIQVAPNQAVDLNDNQVFTDSGDLGSAFTLATASTRGVGVRINISTPFDSPSDPTTEKIITVATPEMADLLEDGNYVRIIRPGDFGQPVDQVLTVTDVDSSTPSVTVKGFNTVGTYRTGYMMVRVSDPNGDHDNNPNTNAPANPCTVQYYLTQDNNSSDSAQMLLVRKPSDGNEDTIATNITGLTFRYFLDDGTKPTSVSGSDLANIRAIQVTLTGKTDANRSAGGGGVTTRTLSAIIALHNR